MSKNPEGNLTGRQVEFAKTIHSSATICSDLINDILDLSKIESGTVIVDVGEVTFRDLHDYVDRTFRHVAEAKKLDFAVDMDAALPREMHTDAKRLQQILKNLLSNAFKFTDKGSVTLEIQSVSSGWNQENQMLTRAKSVVAFSVKDTGHRDSRGEAADHFRGVPAGGRKHQPQIRRHRSGPGDQPRNGAIAGRGNPADEQSGKRQRFHAVSAADVRPGEVASPQHRKARRYRLLTPNRRRWRRWRNRRSNRSSSLATNGSTSPRAIALC